MCSCLSFASSLSTRWQWHISWLYMLESSTDGPPNVTDKESPKFEMCAGKRSEMSTGVLGSEIKLPEEIERSPDEDASETLGVVYMSLHPVCC